MGPLRRGDPRVRTHRLRYSDHPKAAEAGYAALLAYAKRAKELQGPAQDAWNRQATESALRFAARFPDHPKAPAVLTHAAETLYAQGDLPRAREAAQTVIRRYPQATRAQRRTAWTVEGHAAFDSSAYAEAEAAYKAALVLVPPKDKDRPKLKERLAASVYEQGVAARKAGDLHAAATHFLRVGTVVPGASIEATSLYDGAAALLALKAWPEAIAVLQRMRTDFPNNEHQPEITRRLAVAYMNNGDKLNAAVEFERMGRSAARSPEARRESLLQAANLYREQGAQRRAVDTLEAYVKAFPQPPEAATEARQQIADLYKQQGDLKAYRAWLRRLIDAEGRAGKASTERMHYLAANASMVLAEDARRRYEAVNLVEPLRNNLRAKKKDLEAALAAYTRAADYGVADVATAATFHIADLYYDFSRSLLKSQRPGNLHGEELEQYNLMLEDQAFPFEEKAIKIHEVNIHRVPDGYYDQWIKRSFKELAKLVPARYAKKERSDGPVSSLD